VGKNHYELSDAKVLWIEEMAPGKRFFGIRFLKESDQKKFTFIPGQFVFLSIPGHGEFAVSICSSPRKRDHFEILVSKVGSVTTALFGLNVGAKVGIRGPYGNGFDLSKFYDKDIIIVAGGCGAAPLRSVVNNMIYERYKYGKLYFLYGARNPQELLFKKDLMDWQKNMKVLLTVDLPDKNWQGKTGVVTTLFDDVKTNKQAMAITCGSPVMFKFVLVELKAKGMADKNIYLSLERRMKCGIGKCQHCTCGEKYACIDGPVFSYNQIKENFEAV